MLVGKAGSVRYISLYIACAMAGPQQFHTAFHMAVFQIIICGNKEQIPGQKKFQNSHEFRNISGNRLERIYDQNSIGISRKHF